MASIGSIANTTQIVQNLTQLQSQASVLEQQISTGLKSQSFADLAPEAGRIVDLTAQQSQNQNYIDTIDTVNTRLQTMGLAMTNIETLTQQFSQGLQQAAFSGDGTTVPTEAKSLLQQIGDYLNTQDGTRYLFSGNQTGTPAFDAAGLPVPGDLTTLVNGAPPAGYYQGDNGIAQATVDQNVTLQYGVTANNSAFEQIIRVLNFYANSGPLSASNAADVANVAQAQQILTGAATKLEQIIANSGLQESQLKTLQQAHQSAITLASTTLSGIEQVDPAAAITQLNDLQTQLQASYQTVSMLQGLSLANYLK
jgi:flagellar hook-associated protein 3 FlgL